MDPQNVVALRWRAGARFAATEGAQIGAPLHIETLRWENINDLQLPEAWKSTGARHQPTGTTFFHRIVFGYDWNRRAHE